MKILIGMLYIISTLLTGCAANGPGYPFFDTEQTLQGPTPLINQEDFASVYLPSLLNPEPTPKKNRDSYKDGDIDQD